MYCCHCYSNCCIIGILGIICSFIQFIIICCLFVLIINLVFKRICIEPIHHPDGEYRWALTKNGKPIKWFNKK